MAYKSFLLSAVFYLGGMRGVFREVSIIRTRLSRQSTNFAAADAWSGNFFGNMFDAAQKELRQMAILPKAWRGRQSGGNRAFNVARKSRRRNARTGRRGHRSASTQGGVFSYQRRQRLRLGKMRGAAVFYEKGERIRLRKVFAIFKYAARPIYKKRQRIRRQGQIFRKSKRGLLREIRRLSRRRGKTFSGRRLEHCVYKTD